MLDVSIIVPVYCRTEQSLEWLEECLKSAKKQDCEVVVYDDASPLDITQVAEKCRVDILLHGDRNLGAAYARNQAAEAATKRLLLPLDCDDRLVKGAAKKLLNVWHGEPVYPDVRKFGDEFVDHYVLLDFHCDHIHTHVGFSSVNVLHSKEQWRKLGGWNPSINYFEDGEYNARLFSTFCGVHLKEPLVEYRIHPQQRTKLYKDQSSSIARRIIQKIRSYPMACPGCAKKRASVTASNNVSSQQSGLLAASRSVRMAQDVNSLPGEVNGRVLAQYVGGKGKGKHYYQGRTTKFRYQVVFGQYIHADPRDVKEPGDNVGQSLLVRVPRKDDAKPQPQPKPVASVVAVEEKLPKRTPRLDVPKTPVLDDKTPDARRMSIPDIVKFNPTYEQAVEMLEQERKGQKRKGAIEYLKRIVDK